MADSQLDTDNDSAYGDGDDYLWPNSMLASPIALAGTKRSADSQDAQSTAAALAAKNDCRPCEGSDCFKSVPTQQRPSKRKASAADVGAFHKSSDDHNLEGEDQFPDVCFEKFCQDCNWETPCNSLPCPLPCPEAQCEHEACWDPHCQNTCDDAHCDKQYCVDRGHCDQQPCVEPCLDQCIDPECTNMSGTNEPCFCQNCDVQPCPLGEPNNECHLSHSAPTSAGTILCYASTPCHFQEGLHDFNPNLSSYASYPCYSQSHGAWDEYHTMAQPSSAATPTLSYHTSLESAYSSQPSPTPTLQPTHPSCLLNISTEHCHIDNSCCHGEARACGDDPSAPQEYIELFKKSIAQGNELANNLTDFGLNNDCPTLTSTVETSTVNPKLENLMLTFDNSWMSDNAQYNAAQTLVSHPTTPLDLLASAVQTDMLKTEFPSENQCLDMIGSSAEEHMSICKWQHSPGVLCLASFNSAEALHRHIKSAHVDNCNRSFCQWEGCEAASKDFKQRSKLSRHLLGHAGYRPYACSFDGCDKTFATNQAKANHERTHTGDRPYECKQCGYTTTTYTQLQTHISALHEGKKPHKCRFCDFSCADSSNLSKHERTHQTLRPYRCIHPGCTFKPDCRWENLKRHLRRSGHCPELLVEGSESYKSYRDAVRREIDDFNKRSGGGVTGRVARRKGNS